MGKILAGGSGKISLRMIRTESKGKGHWNGWVDHRVFLSKAAESEETERRRGKMGAHEATHSPVRGEIKIGQVTGVSPIQRKN